MLLQNKQCKDGVLRVTQTEGNLLKREITIRGEGSILGHTNCSFIVSRFGVEITVSLIGALLAEQRILIGGDSVSLFWNLFW